MYLGNINPNTHNDNNLSCFLLGDTPESMDLSYTSITPIYFQWIHVRIIGNRY